MPTFEVGKDYDRKLEIHGPSGGQGSGNRTAGIAQVRGFQYIFWNPHKKLYANRWIHMPHEFIYTGEGNFGDMKETRSTNADLIRCEESGHRVGVFYKMVREGSHWRYLGEYRIIQHAFGLSKDTAGNWRRDLRFHLSSTHEVDALRIGRLPKPKVPIQPRFPTEEELWRILSSSAEVARSTRRRRSSPIRDKRVADPVKTRYVLARVERFGGACELCGTKPGWTASDGLPHYQAHHLNPEIDAVDWIAGICGTCHDRLHYSTDRDVVSRTLRDIISKRHALLGRPRSEVSDEPGIAISDWQECAEVVL